MRPRVFVTRPVYPAALERLRAHAEVDAADDRAGLGADALLARVRDADALVCQLTDPIPAALLEAAPRLRVVANIAVGYDNIDVPAATRLGILVTNTPGVLTESTADFTFTLLLATARRVVEADAFVRAERWKRWEVDLLCGVDVHGKTLGIVGMGRIGQAVAGRAQGFGMRVLYASRRAVPAYANAEHVPLDDLLARADFVTVHVPLTAGTRHLLDAAALARMRPGALLVNTARGPIVDEQALVEALQSGRLAGAGLDVFEREPQLTAGLRDLPNVVLAPHLGSATVETRTLMCTMAADNALAALRDERPPCVVNAEAWERRRR